MNKSSLNLSAGVYIEYKGASTQPKARTIFIDLEQPRPTKEDVKEAVAYACKVDGPLTDDEVLQAISNTFLQEYEEVGLTDPPSEVEFFLCRAALNFFQTSSIKIVVDGTALNASYKRMNTKQFLALAARALATNPSFNCFGFQSY